MEFFEHGDLASCISQPLPEEEAKTITCQVLEALDFMHQKNFTHRDLKPSVSLAPGYHCNGLNHDL